MLELGGEVETSSCPADGKKKSSTYKFKKTNKLLWKDSWWGSKRKKGGGVSGIKKGMRITLGKKTEKGETVMW